MNDLEYDKGMMWDLGGYRPPNRVTFQEEITESVRRIPFLERFLFGEAQRQWLLGKEGVRFTQCPFSPKKINEYLGYEQIRKGDAFTSGSINNVLIAAEQRGDI